MMQRRRKGRPSVAKGLAGGLVAGLGATWVMTQAQQAMTRALSSGNGQGSRDDESGSGSDEPSTVKVASALSRTVTGRPVPEKRKAMAGQMVHYGSAP